MVFALILIAFLFFSLCADAGNSLDWMHRKAKGTWKGGEEQ